MNILVNNITVNQQVLHSSVANKVKVIEKDIKNIFDCKLFVGTKKTSLFKEVQAYPLNFSAIESDIIKLGDMIYSVIKTHYHMVNQLFIIVPKVRVIGEEC